MITGALMVKKEQELKDGNILISRDELSCIVSTAAANKAKNS